MPYNSMNLLLHSDDEVTPKIQPPTFLKIQNETQVETNPQCLKCSDIYF